MTSLSHKTIIGILWTVAQQFAIRGVSLLTTLVLAWFLAPEDYGLVAMMSVFIAIAVSAMQAVEFIGMPEARITLSQATTYLACAPKSNAAYLAIDSAMADVENGRTLPVPRHLQSGVKPDKGDVKYRYAHDGKDHFVDQEYAPTDKIYYEPSEQGYEETIRKRIEYWNALRKKR